MDILDALFALKAGPCLTRAFKQWFGGSTYRQLINTSLAYEADGYLLITYNGEKRLESIHDHLMESVKAG